MVNLRVLKDKKILFKFINLEIEGSNEQLNKEFTITVNNNLTFQLDNYNNNDSVFINGTAIYVHKENLIENYKSFQERMKVKCFSKFAY